MEKKSKLNLVLNIALIIIMLILLGFGIFFVVAYFVIQDQLRGLSAESQLLTDTLRDSKYVTTIAPIKPSSTVTTPTISNQFPKVQEQYYTWIKVSADFTTYLDSIKSKTDMPFFYLKDSNLTSDIAFNSYIEIKNDSDKQITQSIKTYDGATLIFSQDYEGNKVALTQGIFGAGGTCQESYYLDTKIGGKSPSVCVNPNETLVSFLIDLGGENPYWETSNFMAVFNKNLPKSDFENFIKSLEKVN